MSVLITGGRIVDGAKDFVADLLIEGETIAALGESVEAEADRRIDATGLYVIPGAIDPHTHMEMPFGGTVSCDDFSSGTIAAAFGGTTTIVDFCLQAPGQTIPDALATWHEKIERCRPVVDVGFHLAVTDVSQPNALDDLAGVVDAGVTSYKLFMAYKGAIMVDDETLFRSMKVAAETGALVMVHAENGDVIDVLVKDALKDGKTEPRFHAETRPMLTEAEATARALYLAQIAGSRLYVVHVSCEDAIRPITQAREAGWQATGETCTQYLFIDETFLGRPDFEGAKYVFTPPPRPREQQQHLWDALANNVLSVVSSDHAPFNWGTQKTLGRDDFSKIPNGAPGVEDRLVMLHHFGVQAGKISLNRFVELVATNPAKSFGLYPRKGTLRVGSDADVVVWDPERRATLSAQTHHSNIDYNLYEGTEVVGGPRHVLVRGQMIVDDGRLTAEPGAGQFVKRAPAGAELPGRAAIT